jgi:hypothetical protein
MSGLQTGRDRASTFRVSRGRQNRQISELGADTAMAQLEQFMGRVCKLIEDHPEWRHQNHPERMENALRALQQL